jgi:hypothetical protein
MTAADLERAFKTYFDEIGRCTASKCYWALLHLVVVLPDSVTVSGAREK